MHNTNTQLATILLYFTIILIRVTIFQLQIYATVLNYLLLFSVICKKILRSFRIIDYLLGAVVSFFRIIFRILQFFKKIL